MDATTVAVIGAELIFLAAAVGAAAGQIWILPYGQFAEDALLIATRGALWRLLGLGLVLFLAASAAELLLRTASMSDLPPSEAYAQLGTVLRKTHYGHFWLWRCAALVAVTLAWTLSRQPRQSRPMAIIAFIALGAVALTLSASGHAGDDGFFSQTNFANTLHILGGMLWGGGILATLLVILPRLSRDAGAPRELAALSALRLSTLAATALAMVIIPGVYNAWQLVGSWHGLWATSYGKVLVIKLATVAVMAALGALNRYRYVPALQRHAGLPEPSTLIPLPRFLRGGDSAPVASFLTSLRMEAALLLAVLLLAAALSQQVPAVHAEHEGMEGHVHSDD